MANWAVDTNILINAFANLEPDHLSIVVSIGVSHNTCICLDYGSVILNEYEKNLSKNPGYRKWYNRLHQKQAC